MVDFTRQGEKFQYGYAANEEARKSAVLANYGYRHKLIYYDEESIIRKWKEMLINAPILLHNALFILFAVADMIISWDMFRDIVHNAGIYPTLRVPAVIVFCLLINAWAAVTAHLIGKGWSREIMDWERWNFIFIKHRNQTPVNIISDEMSREKNRARFWAIFSGFILLGLISVIIYYRNHYIGSEPPGADASVSFEDNAADTSGQTGDPGLKLVMGYLPLAIILGELLTGDYIWYSIRLLQKKYSRNRNMKTFLRSKEMCGQHDQLAMQYIQSAKNIGEPIELIGDLEKANLRARYRSQQNDDYVDPLDNFRRFGFNFKYRGSGKPVSDARVFAILPNGSKTGDYTTDHEGKVIIPIEGTFDKLVAIDIQNREYLGPFQANGEHYIDLPELVSSNGVH